MAEKEEAFSQEQDEMLTTNGELEEQLEAAKAEAARA